MPVLPQHTKELKDCKYADLRSIGKGREGGACTAAAFLQEFVVDQQEQDGGYGYEEQHEQQQYEQSYEYEYEYAGGGADAGYEYY